MPARAFVVCETQAVGTSLAVDRAFGRARQARSTWPWSERAQVGPSVAQKDGSRARGPPIRAGQHRVPQARPIGGSSVISMFEPAFASCVAEKPATACTSPLKSDASFPYASRWGKLESQKGRATGTLIAIEVLPKSFRDADEQRGGVPRRAGAAKRRGR